MHQGSKGLSGKLTRSEKAGRTISSLLITFPCPKSQYPPNSASVSSGRCWQQPLHVHPFGCRLSVTPHAVLQYARAEWNGRARCLGQLSQLTMAWLPPLFPVTDLIDPETLHPILSRAIPAGLPSQLGKRDQAREMTTNH